MILSLTFSSLSAFRPRLGVGDGPVCGSLFVCLLDKPCSRSLKMHVVMVCGADNRVDL